MRLPLAAGFFNFSVAIFGSTPSGSGSHSFYTSSLNDMPGPRLRLSFFPRAFMRSSRYTSADIARMGDDHPRFRDAASLTSLQPPIPHLIACNGLFAASHHVSF
jgi:hypothetical protein